MRFAICDLRGAVCDLRFTGCGLRFTIYDLRGAICGVRGADYILQLDKQELTSLRSKISTLKDNGRGQHSKYPPKAFTEKGLYMLEAGRPIGGRLAQQCDASTEQRDYPGTQSGDAETQTHRQTREPENT